MKFLILISLALVLNLPKANALELDPFLTWIADIQDSTDKINQFINKTIKETAEQATSAEACELVAQKTSKRLHLTITTSKRLLKFIRDPRNGIEQTRGLRNNYFGAVADSIYRFTPQLYVTSLSHVIALNGVRVGDDKLAHFFAFGRRYYKRYLDEIAKGNSHEGAEKQAILFGIKMEKGFFGSIIDGIFSYADLEANYQGMRFHQDLCDPTKGILVTTPSGWVKGADIDMRDYVTPAFDELFNNSHFIAPYSKSVLTRIKRHCWMLREQKFISRLVDYVNRDVPSYSRAVISEYMTSRGENRKSEHNIFTICASQ